MNHEKIIKKDSNYRVKCHKTDEFINVKECQDCSRFKRIDPVKSELICREQK